MLISSCDGSVTHCLIKDKTPFYSRITSTKSLSACMTTCSASLTNLTPLLPQSRDCSRYVSRPILAPPPLWLHEHADLRVHDFAHSPDLWRHSRLANVSCVRSWRLCGVSPAVILSGCSYCLELNLTVKRYDSWVVKVLTLSSASLPK